MVAHQLLRYPALFAIVAVLNVPIYILVARSFFDGWDELWQMFRYWFGSPFQRLQMFFSGESAEVQWPIAKLLALLLFLSLLVISEYSFIADHFPNLGESAQRLF